MTTNNKIRGAAVTKLTKHIITATLAALSIQVCYGQWGVAAGAGVEQWNRQRELDMQQQQLDMQKQVQQMEMERMRREQDDYRQRRAQQEEARRQYEEDQRRLVAEKEQRCREQNTIIIEFETSRGEDGQAVAKRVRQVAAEQGKNGCLPALATGQFKETLENLFKEIRGTRIIDEKITKFMSTKKEYKSPQGAEAFRKELDLVIAESGRGEIKLPDSLEGTLALTHQRVIKRLAGNKQTASPKKNI